MDADEVSADQETITEHYNDQIRQLAGEDKEAHAELLATITRFRDEEQEHHDIGLEHDAELAPAYQVFLVVFWNLFLLLSSGFIRSNQSWMQGRDLAK